MTPWPVLAAEGRQHVDKPPYLRLHVQIREISVGVVTDRHREDIQNRAQPRGARTVTGVGRP